MAKAGCSPWAHPQAQHGCRDSQKRTGGGRREVAVWLLPWAREISPFHSQLRKRRLGTPGQSRAWCGAWLWKPSCAVTQVTQRFREGWERPPGSCSWHHRTSFCFRVLGDIWGAKDGRRNKAGRVPVLLRSACHRVGMSQSPAAAAGRPSRRRDTGLRVPGAGDPLPEAGRWAEPGHVRWSNGEGGRRGGPAGAGAARAAGEPGRSLVWGGQGLCWGAGGGEQPGGPEPGMGAWGRPSCCWPQRG